MDMHTPVPEGQNPQTCQPWGPLLSTIHVCVGRESKKHQRFTHSTESGCCTPKQAENREITGDQ